MQYSLTTVSFDKHGLTYPNRIRFLPFSSAFLPLPSIPAMGATSAMAPSLLRNLITTIFTISVKSLHTLSTHSNLLKFIRRFITSFLYFLSSFIPNPNPTPNNNTHLTKNPKAETFSNNSNDSGLARALSQLLTIVNDLPVSSRKYEIVRSLAERMVDDNNRQGFESLREVNRRALTTSFERTLRCLENAAVAGERGDLGLGFGLLQADFYYLGRALKLLRYIGDAAWARFVNFKPVDAAAVAAASGCGLGEKLAAEVLWLAQKLAACGYVEEAVDKWASASRLAWLALRVEPRLQGAMVKVSAFLFKQAGEIGRDGEAMYEERKIKQKVMKLKMLVSWLPLLCRAGNGVDAPVLSALERGELEVILEEMIDGLDCIEDQEKVLSLWIHHFTYCPSSDWPNLRECYARWCNESRKRMHEQ